MKSILTCVPILLLSFPILLAQLDQKQNFDFEKPGYENHLAKGWFQWGNFNLTVDHEVVHEGKSAAKVTSIGGIGSFGSVAYRIPGNFGGTSITLKGYMKYQNVNDGFAGLLLRVDKSGKSVAFDNMESRELKGTSDWALYEIILPMPEDSDMIIIGGILVGSGSVWFDDFELAIDGADIHEAKQADQKVFPAQQDHEFDEGSAIQFPDLTDKRVRDLQLLGRIWGFLKYHHQTIARGELNWDYELFRFLPTYLEAIENEERDQSLVTWIEKLGPISNCDKCAQGDENSFLQPNLNWLDEEGELGSWKTLLKHIYKNRNQSNHFYIEMAPGVGNPIFKNENDYDNMPYPDEGFRLLSLFRYWNMITYFFPYRHLMKEDWNAKLIENIPQFIEAKDELSYEMAALHLIFDIHDTHANLWGGADKIKEWKGNYYSATRVEFVEDQLVVTAFYNDQLKEATGLSIGDVITHVDGRTIMDIVDDMRQHYPASNEPTRLRNIARDLLRSQNRSATIRVVSDLPPREIEFKLYEKKEIKMSAYRNRPKEKCFKVLEGNIGYITLANIQNEDIDNIKNELRETKGIIIDIRNYPSTFVPFILGNYFMKEESPFVKFTMGSTSTPGEFFWRGPNSIPSSTSAYDNKLVILVNEKTQSQAEYTTMAFQAGTNTTVIGSTTAGADGNISRIDLPGGLRTIISGIGVYYPDGQETQGVGIEVDIEVKPTVKGIRQGRDELLERGIEFILRE